MASKTIEQRRRELREEYHSDKFWPMSKEQIDAFDKATADESEPKARLTGFTLLYTGMRNGEFCHMRRNWVKQKTIDGETMVVIEIPPAEPCTGGAGSTGKDNAEGADLHRRGETCAKCRGQGRDHWEPKTSNGDRQITIREQGAIDALNWWFDQNEEIPLMHNAVNRRLRRLKNKAGIGRKITAHDLRDTYATMLVRKGFDPHPIKRIMGHNDPERLEDYFKFVGKHQQEEFLEKW